MKFANTIYVCTMPTNIEYSILIKASPVLNLVLCIEYSMGDNNSCNMRQIKVTCFLKIRSHDIYNYTYCGKMIKTKYEVADEI